MPCYEVKTEYCNLSVRTWAFFFTFQFTTFKRAVIVSYKKKLCIILCLKNTLSLIKNFKYNHNCHSFQASRGHNDALHVLLGCIMNLDIKDVNGRTMLDLACYSGHTECVETLLLQGATILVYDNVARRTPLHAAGNLVKAEYLIVGIHEEF